MSTTFYKLSGELLSANEAETAAQSYTPPTGYEFKHWSSNANADVEVTELNPGGVGVVITSDKTYYPVVEIISWVSLTKSGNTITYNIREGAEQEGTVDSGSLVITSTTHRVFRIQGIGNSAAYEIGQSVSQDTTGTETYDPNTCYCDFGEVHMPVASGVTGYQIVSEVDGATYYLKVTTTTTGVHTLTYSIEVYKLIDGVVTNITADSYFFTTELD